MQRRREERFGIATRVGDIVDARVANDVLRETRPDVLLLVAGATLRTRRSTS